jgi:hypothetical protein
MVKTNKNKGELNMFDAKSLNLDFDFGTGDVTQESYDANSSSYSDIFDEKFNSFNPEAIVSGGNNKLKSAMFDMDIEDSDLALGYKNSAPGSSPKPGKFFD